MRTATDDAQYLADYIDAFLVREHATSAGDFHKHVMKDFETSTDARLSEIENLDMSPEGVNWAVNCCLWAAHHIESAKRFDAAGDVARAYQEVIEAYKCTGNMTSYRLIVKSLVTQAAPMKKAQAFRHLMTKEIEAFAVSRFRAETFPSAHKASIALAPEVRQFAAEKGKPMSEDRASKTIYEWLLRSMKGGH
jgi:hypothetical protein